MTTNMVYGDIPSTRRVVEVGSKVAPGTPVATALGAGVTLTGSGDFKPTARTIEGVEFPLRDRGGVGLGDTEATVAFSGSFAFEIEGADETTEAGTQVYVADGKAALTGDVPLGKVEFVRPGADGTVDVVVKIGA